ncbi:MAG: sulfotransferase family protein [Bacteroidetes bacterium]|nr:sulfotransferase family protein [Bacteroidota bacterium]MDA1120244.1 sulfotransferase family protein [Bacteroidota bacterium]
MFNDKINLVSCPRNLSTALMYSFAQRMDTTVIDEPFYGYYLKLTDADHPGKEEILKSMSIELMDILKDISRARETPVLFVKNMAQHLYQIDLSFIRDWLNIIFIRDPMHIIASFSRVIQRPTIFDIGVEEQFKIYGYLVANGKSPLILNSQDLVINPRAILERLCDEMNILFDPKMLSWKAGARKEDGIWAKYWYTSVHRSTGFTQQKTNNPIIPSHLIALCDQAMVYYDQLNKLAIKP